MKGYESPNAEFVEFDNGRINTAGSKCNCYGERWNYAEYDIDDPSAVATGCKLESMDFIEVADAEVIE